MIDPNTLDWSEVAAIMACCVAGAPSGGPHIPSAHERRVLDQARRKNIKRYRLLYARLKAEAIEDFLGS